MNNVMHGVMRGMMRVMCVMHGMMKFFWFLLTTF
jgi:hypothetical protein